MQISQFNNDNKGFFKAEKDGKQAGLMFYTWAGADKIIIDHTEVEPEFNGQNVGKNMAMAAIEYARKNRIKIIPLCPFVKSLFNKTPEIRDVLF